MSYCLRPGYWQRGHHGPGIVLSCLTGSSLPSHLQVSEPSLHAHLPTWVAEGSLRTRPQRHPAVSVLCALLLPSSEWLAGDVPLCSFIHNLLPQELLLHARLRSRSWAFCPELALFMDLKVQGEEAGGYRAQRGERYYHHRPQLPCGGNYL